MSVNGNMLFWFFRCIWSASLRCDRGRQSHWSKHWQVRRHKAGVCHRHNMMVLCYVYGVCSVNIFSLSNYVCLSLDTMSEHSTGSVTASRDNSWKFLYIVSDWLTGRFVVCVWLTVGFVVSDWQWIPYCFVVCVWIPYRSVVSDWIPYCFMGSDWIPYGFVVSD